MRVHTIWLWHIMGFSSPMKLTLNVNDLTSDPFHRACRAAEVCICRLSGDGIREWQRSGEVQCDRGVCLESPAALRAAPCSGPGSH